MIPECRSYCHDITHTCVACPHPALLLNCLLKRFCDRAKETPQTPSIKKPEKCQRQQGTFPYYTQLSRTQILTKLSSREWAEDVSDNEANDPTALPAPSTVVNKDGTKTTITYKIDDSGRRVKITRKTRTTVHREKVNPEVAERRNWSKFGLEKGKTKGPQPDTTSVGENIIFRPSRDWKAVQADEAKNGGVKEEEKSLKEQLKDKKVKCRICQGEHFTARCPYKDTMAPVGGDNEPAADPMAEDGDAAGATGPGGKSGGLGVGSGGYVPPHLRKGAAASAGERMGGKFERDDLATLRVTNVSYSVPLYLWKYNTNVRAGLRNGRRARTSRLIRTLRKSHTSLPGKGQRNRSC